MNPCVSLLVAAILFAPTLPAADEAVAKPFAGHWEGNARIIVNWCKQRDLPVAVDIHPDGSVTGKVGDATLAHAQFATNRGSLGRALNLYSDYIIRGDLDGAIVAAEGISRPGVFIPLDLAEGALAGGIHTSGSKVGGREEMILSASNLKLVRKQ